MSQDGVPILISAQDPSFWQSCLTIVPQLAQAYDLAFGRRKKTLRVPGEATDRQLLALAKKIHRLKPSKLIFYDHRPHPERLLRALHQVNRGRWPSLYFHIYGGFTLETPHWERTEPFLKGAPITFICPSERHARMVAHFVQEPQSRVVESAFSVDTSVGFYDSKARQRGRKKLRLNEDAFAVIYAGRLSEQKNIDWLIESFVKFADTKETPCELFLAGLFDDLGVPMFAPLDVPGSYYFHIERVLARLAPELRQKIHFLGMLEADELTDLYQAGDLFVSFSVHHDEDFGISPAEALCIGTPVLLTDWGGFSSYHRISPGDVGLMPVFITKEGLVIDTQNILNQFEFFFARRKDEAARARRSALFQKHLSPEAAAERLIRIHRQAPQKFVGFKPILQKHAALWKQKPIFSTENAEIYHEVYRSYVRESDV